MTEKPILAFDCSTPAASVALKVASAVDLRTIEHGRQATELVPVIDDLLREHGVQYSGLGAILTTLGPGSFTGLRIALATLHGLVLAVPVKIKTLTSLEAVAWEVIRRESPPVDFLVTLNAGKGEVFCQRFALTDGAPRTQDDIALIKPGELNSNKLLVFGNLLDGTHPNYISGPSAAVLCEIADELPETALAAALPLYIRAPDAKIPTPPLWLKSASHVT